MKVPEILIEDCRYASEATIIDINEPWIFLITIIGKNNVIKDVIEEGDIIDLINIDKVSISELKPLKKL